MKKDLVWCYFTGFSTSFALFLVTAVGGLVIGTPGLGAISMIFLAVATMSAADWMHVRRSEPGAGGAPEDALSDRRSGRGDGRAPCQILRLGRRAEPQGLISPSKAVLAVRIFGRRVDT